jgi:hypothetical protein
MRPISDVLLNDPSGWRERAKQLRADAGVTPDREETRLLLELGEMHEKFAADIEARLTQIQGLTAASKGPEGANRNENPADE